MKNILILLFVASAFFSSSQTYFKASTFSCAEHCIVPAPDGGYFNASHRIIGGLSRACLIKTDSLASVQWLMEFMGPDIVAPSDVTATHDSCFVIANKLRYTGGNDQLYIIKLADNPWDTLWTRLYTELGSDVSATSVRELPNHQLVFFGKKTNPNRLFILKTDRDGQIVFEKNFSDTTGYNECNGIVTSDGGFAVTGGLWALIKTDSLGNLQWYSNYKFNTFYNIKRYVLETPDNRLLLFGQDSVVSSTFDYVWLKYELTGNLIGQKVIEGLGSFGTNSVTLLKDKGYILTGERDTASGNFIPALVKLDSMMNVSWANSYMPDPSTFQYGRFQSAFGMSDGRIVAAGYDKYPPHSLPSNLLMITDPDGSSCNAIPFFAQSGPTFNTHNHTFFPDDAPGALQPVMPTSIYILTHNPSYLDVCSTTGFPAAELNTNPGMLVEAGDAWKVVLERKIALARIVIYDITGKVLLRTQVSDGDLIYNEEFSAGVYLYRMESNTGFMSGRIIISD